MIGAPYQGNTLNPVTVKVPQFSLNRLANADNRLGGRCYPQVVCFGVPVKVRSLGSHWFKVK